MQSNRNKHAALRLMGKLLKKQGMASETLVTDRLGAHSAAARELALSVMAALGRLSFSGS